jgi:hypothetical protein
MQNANEVAFCKDFLSVKNLSSIASCANGLMIDELVNPHPRPQISRYVGVRQIEFNSKEMIDFSPCRTR